MAIQLYRHRPWPALSEWFEEFPFGMRSPEGHMIRVEEYEDESSYTVKAELPGIDPNKDVEVTFANGMLTVHAERTEEKKENKHSEFRYGSFTRSVRLPAGAKEDDITATYENGVLTVKAPIGQSEEHAKRIEISS